MTALAVTTISGDKVLGLHSDIPKETQTKLHLMVTPCLPELWNPIYARFANRREGDGAKTGLASIDEELRASGAPSHKRRKIQRAQATDKWHLNVTPHLPELWNPIYERFSKRDAISEVARIEPEREKCGWPTLHGTPCNWSRPCPCHAEKERRAKETENVRKREEQERASKGICGVARRSDGGICDRVRGECEFHAPEEARCKSTKDADPTERCYSWRSDGQDYCAHHKDYPNLGSNFQDYIKDVGGVAAFATNYQTLLQEFFEKRYPEAQGARPDVTPILRNLLNSC